MMATPNILRRPEEIALSLQLPQGCKVVKQHIDGGNPWGLWNRGRVIANMQINYSVLDDEWILSVNPNGEGFISCKPEGLIQILAGLRVRGLI